MRIHVLCFGNLIQGDDGFGIHFYRQAMAMQWPDQVHFFDAGILGYGAVNYFEDCDHVVIIDAMNFENKEGEFHWLELKDLKAPVEKFSMHAIDLAHLFYVIPMVIPEHKLPKINILAIEIIKCEKFCEFLSPKIEACLKPALLNLQTFISKIKKEEFCEC